ncbi:hypothetical protein [Streptomyces sp. NPDC059828]|uniref:hypothetical protein n=1 Tax=Streptomyces sp. NPDC059828 TaxID=3346965 RepID=UPI00364A0853
MWSAIGYGQIAFPQPDQRGLKLLLDLAPLAVWGWLWVTAGLIAVVSAFLPQGVDWLGFLSLPAIVLPWMLSYLASWALGIFDRGWIAALVWGAIAVPVLVVAGWREPPRPKRIETIP